MSSSNHTYTFQEELANALSHGLGVIFGVVALPVPIAMAAAQGNMPGLIGSAVFGLGFLLVFSFSTLYHAVRHPATKQFLRVMDHISIYWLIAGTYTPFLLVTMWNSTGFAWLAVMWAAVLIGMVFKIFATGRWNLVSTAMYLVMGWAIIAIPGSFFSAMSLPVMSLVVAGGVSYTIGVLFYRWHSLRFHHAIWHLFVLGGAVCHYAAVLLVVQ